ncbi:hypothetical protein [Nonomuraea basaltis]|uniref:hypothetical protein n=1 Tax=Nonomuraea basaltis TaxID=2495887 RepID=UPI00110C438D|nr:hypothetical protein [Nonomuraea basaltis]TMR98881.1 hypothetical protein EJK15_10075 [Nonomuraea basaltis]
MRLPAELRDYLATLRGDLLRGRLVGSAADAGWVACDLIGTGVDTPTTLELAGHALSIGSMSEIEPLIRQVLSECGMPPIDTQQEPWAVARDISLAMRDGTLPISPGADFLIAQLAAKCGYPPEITQLMILIDDWEAIQITPPTDDELRAHAGKIAEVAEMRSTHMPPLA